MNDVANAEGQTEETKINPNEDPEHPIRKPVSKFSVGQEVLFEGTPVKITEFDETTGKYKFMHASLKEVSESDISEIPETV